MYIGVTLAAMSVVGNQTTVRKHGILSIICILPHTMYLVCSNTPPPPWVPLRMCKKNNLINILIHMNDYRNKQQRIHI
jgi:hypothetical protein